MCLDVFHLLSRLRVHLVFQILGSRQCLVQANHPSGKSSYCLPCFTELSSRSSLEERPQVLIWMQIADCTWWCRWRDWRFRCLHPTWSETSLSHLQWSSPLWNCQYNTWRLEALPQRNLTEDISLVQRARCTWAWTLDLRDRSLPVSWAPCRSMYNIGTRTLNTEEAN